MEIRFKDKKLRELCEKRAAAEKKLGSACARKLRARLDDLDAAERVSEVGVSSTSRARRQARCARNNATPPASHNQRPQPAVQRTSSSITAMPCNTPK